MGAQRGGSWPPRTAGVEEKLVRWRPGDTAPQTQEAPDPASLHRGTVSFPAPTCSLDAGTVWTQEGPVQSWSPGPSVQAS